MGLQPIVHSVTIRPNKTFLFRQMLMSALQIPVPVTRTLIALTVTVLIAALANRGLMEMVQLVKVSACRPPTENITLGLKPGLNDVCAVLERQ